MTRSFSNSREGVERPDRSAKRFRFHTRVISQQPPDALDLFCHTLASIDDEKAWIVGKRIIDNRAYLTVRTVAGDVFEIERPPISEELEAMLMSGVRDIVADVEGDE